MDVKDGIFTNIPKLIEKIQEKESLHSMRAQIKSQLSAVKLSSLTSAPAGPVALVETLNSVALDASGPILTAII